MSILQIPRRGMMGSAAALPDTNPELVYTPNKYLTKDSSVDGEDMTGAGITDYLPVARNDVFVYYNPASALANQNGILGQIVVYNNNKASADWWNCRANGTAGSFTCLRFTGNGYVRLNVPMEGIKDCYAYNSTTGVIYYAGINTLYYGKTNIND